MSHWIDVCKEKEITPGSFEMADLNNIEIAVFNIDGNLYAIEDLCTHDGGYLVGGKIEGERITCPRHNAHFSVKSGKCLSEQAYDTITTYPVRIKDGVVQVMDQPLTTCES